MKNFEDFVFPQELKKELKFLLDNPKKIPSPLCFYGVPAQGKTSFAKYLANEVSNSIEYFDANSYLSENHDASSILKDIHRRGLTIALDGGVDKPWDRCFIIDEWHNFTKKRQDSYKVALEQLASRGFLTIICCNTDSKNTIKKVLTPAIYSRCHKIRFDILQRQVPEVLKLAKERYPMLDEDFIARNIPDWRAISREVMMMS